MKTITFFMVFFFSFCFSQSEKNLKLYMNSIGFEHQKTLDSSTIKNIVSDYECLEREYKFNIYKDAYFLNKKQFIKKYKNAKPKTIESKSFFFQVFNADSEKRKLIQEKYSKCIESEIVDF